MKECIVVLGMHRSGTSALAGMLSTLGIYPGDSLLGASSSNSKGYFENTKVYELNKEIMAHLGSAWDDVEFDISLLDSESERIFIDKAKHLLEEDYQYLEKFLIKDPRLCLVLPIWMKAFKELKITFKPLFILRNPMEVALSLRKRNKMSVEQSLKLWVHHYLQSEMYTRKSDRFFLHYDDLLLNTSDVIEQILLYLGLDIVESVKIEAEGTLDRGIKNNRLVAANSDDIPEMIKNIIALFSEKKIKVRKLDSYRKEFYGYLDFFNASEEVISLEEHQLALDEERLKNQSHKHNLLVESVRLKNSNKELYKKVCMFSGKQIDIVIPVYNAQEYVADSIDSILSADCVLLNRIIIVNDGSALETTQYLRQLANKEDFVFLIDQEENQGYTKSVNAGIEASDSKYVVLLNSDTVVSDNWLEKLIVCAETDSNIGIVGPLSNAASWQTVPVLFGKDGGFKINSLPDNYSVADMANLVEDASYQIYPQVSVVNGFCFLIKRCVIDAIGLMDEVSFPTGYGEENDYCIRAEEAGFTLVIADDCYVYHAKSKSFGHSQREKLSAQGSKSLKKKHGDKKLADLVKRVKGVVAFDAIRESISSEFRLKQRVQESLDPKMVFILPTPGAGGGSHSIVQEVQAMQLLGVNAKIAIEERCLSDVLKRYSDIPHASKLFVAYTKASLFSIIREFDVAIATIFHSVKIVKGIIEVYPHILPAYYVQDYEPMFFKEGSDNRVEAFESYSLVKNMLLFAKTNWIVKQIALFNGVHAKKVSPSIDHDVYYPLVAEERPEGITISAMIRPQTPYRGAERTMELFSKIKRQFGDGVNVRIFGCEDSNPAFKKLKQDFDFVNLGIITRPEVADCLRNSDVFVDLSDYQAFGRTSLEAMACGCTAMLPCHGGGDEYAIDGYNALVVDSFDENSYYPRFVKLLNTPKHLKEMQKAGLEISSRYSPKLAAISEIEIISKMLSLHRSKYPKKDKDTVLLLPVRRDDNKPTGSAFVRLIQPLYKNKELQKDWDIILSEAEAELPAPSEADIVVIQRDATGLDLYKVVDWLLLWRASGKKVIFELDDDLLDVDGLIKRTGHERKYVEEIVSLVTWLVSAADGVVVSTPSLFRLVSEFNQKTFLQPNYLDAELWGLNSRLSLRQFPRENRDNSIVKIGYIGTPTHNNDLLVIKDAIAKITQEYGSKVEIEVIGAFQRNLQNPLFGKAIELPEVTTYPEFVEWLRITVDWDIALIPLVDDRFNKSKSHLKFLECSALGLASICSNVESYSSVVVDRKNGLLVNNTTEDWIKSLKLLIDNPKLRDSLSNEAYNNLCKNYTTTVNNNLYQQILSGVKSQKPLTVVPSLPKKKGAQNFIDMNNANILKGVMNADIRRNKLFAKLWNNPHRYFSDSKHKPLRILKYLFRNK